MRGRALRFLRILAALIFFSTTAALFLDFGGYASPEASDIVLYSQFTPSIVRWLQGSFIAGSSLVVVLVVTLLGGRLFCSTVCPLGVLQDTARRLGMTLKRRHGVRYTRPHNALRYGVLALFVIGVASGSVLLIGLLDPYSHFGRVMALIFRPVVVMLNNLMSVVSSNWGSYTPALLDVNLAVWHVILVPLAILILVSVMAAFRGRLFCNTLCPVGTLLGIVSRLSLFRIQIDRDKCDHCAKCVVACKSGCIDLKSRSVDVSRCVVCFDCIGVCTEAGIGYRRFRGARSSSHGGHDKARGYIVSFAGASGREPPEAKVDTSRRAFLGLTTAGLAGSPGHVAPGCLETAVTEPALEQASAQERLPVVAPGAKGIDELRSSCIACQLCVSACPTQVLQPLWPQPGAGGILQPHLDFEVGFCAYDCTRCGDVCPTHAIERLDKEKKKRIKIGTVRFIEDNCIAINQAITCGACADYCPTRAVYMVPGENGRPIPRLDPPVCIGCGACEYVCPTQPNKAIVVDAEREHRKAKPPRGFPLLRYKELDVFPF